MSDNCEDYEGKTDSADNEGNAAGYIAVVGSLNADLNVRVQRHPHPGETLLGTSSSTTAGGKGANQALAAHLAGANVRLIGAVGEDHFAEAALEELKAAQMDLGGVEKHATSTGLAMITIAHDGENSIVVIPGANALVDAAFVDNHRRVIAESSLLLLQGEIPAEGFAQAVASARGRVVVNLAPVIEVDAQALLTADPLIANEHEAGLILEQLGRPSPHTALAQAVALRDAGFKSVVLTLGARGALIAEEEEITEVPSPQVEAVDTTGAGDAFAGALAAQLLHGADLRTAAAFAARFAALSVTREGAQPSYPRPGEELPGENLPEKDFSGATQP